jgi:hypothetical protein
MKILAPGIYASVKALWISKSLVTMYILIERHVLIGEQQVPSKKKPLVLVGIKFQNLPNMM